MMEASGEIWSASEKQRVAPPAAAVTGGREGVFAIDVEGMMW